jgi:hypothetical protein
VASNPCELHELKPEFKFSNLCVDLMEYKNELLKFAHGYFIGVLSLLIKKKKRCPVSELLDHSHATQLLDFV